MKRIDLWKSKLKAAKAELRIRARELNTAARAAVRVEAYIKQMEKKIDNHMAKPK